MNRGLLGRVLFLSTMLLGVTTSVAHADPTAQDIAQARDLGTQAQAAFDAGNYAEAEKLFSAATSLYPAAPTLTLGLARAQAKAGKFVAAQEGYNKIIREQSQNSNASPAFKNALAAARDEVGAVTAKIANVVISVEGAPHPVVTLDGQVVSDAALGLRRPVDPGSHVVRAEAQGYSPAETAFHVAESGSASAKLKLVKTEGSPVAVVSSTPATTGNGPVEDPHPTSSNKTLALAAFGVGGAGLVFGAITGVVALGKHGDLSDKCPNDTCATHLQSDVDGYKTMGTLSTIGFIVGGVGLTAGTVLWFTSPKEGTSATKTARNTVSWQPYVGAGGGGVSGRF